MMLRFLAYINNVVYALCGLLLLSLANIGIAGTALPKAYSTSTQVITIPDVALRNQQGQEVSAQALLAATDKPLWVQFIYTSCATTCPVLSATFAAVDKALQGEAHLISISIDPAQDTSAVLAQYAQRYAASADWDFYRGDEQGIIHLQQAFGVYQGNKMRHQALTFISKGNGGQWLKIDGFVAAKTLIAEYRHYEVR